MTKTTTRTETPRQAKARERRVFSLGILRVLSDGHLVLRGSNAYFKPGCSACCVARYGRKEG